MMDITELCKKYRAGKRFKYLYFGGISKICQQPRSLKPALVNGLQVVLK